jgi:hypothetical protein
MTGEDGHIRPRQGREDRARVFRWTLAEDVAQTDNASGVYQGSTRLSSQVTVSHLQSERLGVMRDLR